MADAKLVFAKQPPRVEIGAGVADGIAASVELIAT